MVVAGAEILKNFGMKSIFCAVFSAVLIVTVYTSVIAKSPLRKNNIFQNDPNSCTGRCNQTGTIPNGCQCNTACIRYNDCCEDYYTLCLSQGEGSCAGRCGQPLNPNQPCQCNSQCENFGVCCSDYQQLCEGTQDPITNAELEALAEELFALEGPNNAAHLISWDLQGQTTQGSTIDLAPNPLMTVDITAYTRGTIALLVNLFNNYNPDVAVPEDVTPAETAEEEAFLDAVLETPIMQRLSAFMAEKGVNFNRLKLREMWFGLYSRSGSTLGSSGLEHVFLAELKSGVSGFHNWVFFAREEEIGQVNYRGWMKFLPLGNKGGLIQHNFQWMGQNKPISSMFVGTSPEFELAIYTMCWLTRPDTTSCPVSFEGQKAKVTTWTIGGSKQFVASAYADPL